MNKTVGRLALSALSIVVVAAGATFGPAHAQTPFPDKTELTVPAKPARAPDFELANVQGGTLKSADLKDKVVVIRFWATW